MASADDAPEPVKHSAEHKVGGQEIDVRTAQTRRAGRYGLQDYITHPEDFPSSRVVYYNTHFTVIRDLFPKASIHWLILPRDPLKSITRPQEAFDDVAFLQECQAEERKVHAMVVDELAKMFPGRREWTEEDVKSGIHANPSMAHLHIHVLSEDMVSDCMKKSNHYLSFTTDFLVGLDQFPLEKDDYRRHYGQWTTNDMKCWRCGTNFGNSMAKLKRHLLMEKEEWIKEG
ncbi:HIT-like protein [Piedraia hortae CBS 480.64]|uniref:HIT-like protein n=1 Tax=Piedraia hortae CBS 480.64 TaxID=1314780 RepID=A0A6A7BZL8_9PEZI|nr:HIT-like protein [Piedraia hortae CBS 480.64]